MLSAAWQWSDENFCARVVRRCAELGRSQRAILKEANCAHDYLQTNPAHGRRIDRMSRIAEVLEVPLGDLLGLPVTGQLDLAILTLAYQGAREATELVRQPDDASFVRTMVTIYTVLLSHQADGRDPRDRQVMKLIVDTLRTGETLTRPAEQ